MCLGPRAGEAPPFLLKKLESEAEKPEAKVLWNGAEGLLRDF